MKEYDYLVFIGRFQAFHYGHASVIKRALEAANHVLVLIGSTDGPRSTRNPFTFDERSRTIHNWAENELGLGDQAKWRLHTHALEDFTYNDQEWIAQVQRIVNASVRTLECAQGRSWSDKPPRVGLIGHSKDESSYYLGLFPQWGSINVPPYTDRKLFNSTDVRNAYFGNPEMGDALPEELAVGIPDATAEFLHEFLGSPEYEWLCGEYAYVTKYKQDHVYANGLPYLPTHTTVDAVVVQSGHLLVIERGAHPQKGSLALPGGFINSDETLLNGMLRELKEETKIKVPYPVLKGNIKHQKVFDDPNRSSRGRVFSYTFLIELPPSPNGLPKIKASSDASSAKWMPLSDLDPKQMFEDHYFIIQSMIGHLA